MPKQRYSLQQLLPVGVAVLILGALTVQLFTKIIAF